MPKLSSFTGALIVAALIVGCGKTSDDAPPINKALGSSPAGTPSRAGGIDMGILQDQTAYVPAKYESLDGGAGGGSGGAGDDSGPGADEARAVAADLLRGVYDLDVDLMLGCFDAEQIKALNQDDYRSTMYETRDTLQAFWKVFSEKTKESDLAPLAPLFELSYKAREPLIDALSVKLFDAENANVSVDMLKYEANAAEINAEVQAAMGDAMAAIGPLIASVMGAAGAAPGATAEGESPESPERAAPGPQFSPEALQQMMAGAGPTPVSFEGVPVKKTSEGWKFTLPAPLTEEMAEVTNEGLLLVKETVAELTARMDAAEALDAQGFGPMLVQVGIAKAPLFIAWQAKAMALLGPLLGETAPAEGGDGDVEPDGEGEQEEAPAEPG